jgi:hypothetical protein
MTRFRLVKLFSLFRAVFQGLLSLYCCGLNGGVVAMALAIHHLLVHVWLGSEMINEIQKLFNLLFTVYGHPLIE